MSDYLTVGSVGFLAGGILAFLASTKTSLATQPTLQATVGMLAGFAVAALACGICFLWKRRVERKLEDRWFSQE
ncbi:MAG TPA: hypothetical protein VNS53_06915 [Sphingomicrobium sp.]|jgi:nitrate reductase gamma subunit|nr:hypothetical protein [Sphingomicrobium sp.]